MMDAKYATILHAPRPDSTTHAPMSLMDRAAQFAPFSALAGHTEGTQEVARTTQARLELSEDAAIQLERRIKQLESQLTTHPEVTLTYFLPDHRKEGGTYVTEVVQVKKVDAVWHRLVLANGTEIAIADVLELIL